MRNKEGWESIPRVQSNQQQTRNIYTGRHKHSCGRSQETIQSVLAAASINAVSCTCKYLVVGGDDVIFRREKASGALANKLEKLMRE